MSNNTCVYILSLHGNFYLYIRHLGKTLAVVACVMFPGIASAEVVKTSLHKGIFADYIVQEKKNEICQLRISLHFNRFVRILWKFGIEIEGDFNVCANFRWKSEEIKQKLSTLESRLIKQGKMISPIRAELEVLKTVIGR